MYKIDVRVCVYIYIMRIVEAMPICGMDLDVIVAPPWAMAAWKWIASAGPVTIRLGWVTKN